MGDPVVGAALVPGLPHLLAARDPAPGWSELASACRQAGEWLRAAQPDAMVLLSTQWFTVLGHQVQLDPRLRGERVDENWYGYDFGRISYDLATDVQLASRWADEIDAAGLQARRTHYDNFPIDTGTATATALLDPRHEVPTAMVSCNLYADADALHTVGTAVRRAATQLGRRIVVVAVSGLSSGLIQRWIEPAEDHIPDADHDRWNRRMLDLIAAGKHDEVLALREEYARAAAADSQFRAYPFLAGAGALDGPGEVAAYGPVWGTGAAVIRWPT